MRLLALQSSTDHPHDLTELIALTTDDLLEGLGLSVSERLSWYTQQVTAFADTGLRRQAGEDYRARQKRLRALLGGPAGPGLLSDEVADILRERRIALSAASARLAAPEAAGRLETPRDVLCSSYVHLHCNRLLGGQPPSEGHLMQLLQRTRKGLAVAPMS